MAVKAEVQDEDVKAMPDLQQLIEHSQINKEHGKLRLTPLHVAAWQNNPSALELLLKNGALPNKECAYGFVPLHFAAYRGDLEACKALVARKAKINVYNEYGWSALHFAAFKGSFDVVSFLIDAGADIAHPTSKHRWNALQLAIHGQHLDVIERLLDSGGHSLVRHQDWAGFTALHYAAMINHLTILRWLTLGDDGQLCNIESYSRHRLALDFTVQNRNLEATMLLTSLSKAKAGSWDLEDLKYEPELLSHLRSKGAEVTAKNLGYSPPWRWYNFHKAAMQADLPALQKILAEEGSSILFKRDQRRRTALHIAIAFDHREVVEWLLKKGGSRFIEALPKDGQGRNVMHIACEYGRFEIFKSLIAHGGGNILLQKDAWGNDCISYAGDAENYPLITWMADNQLLNGRHHWINPPQLIDWASLATHPRLMAVPLALETLHTKQLSASSKR